MEASKSYTVGSYFPAKDLPAISNQRAKGTLSRPFQREICEEAREDSFFSTKETQTDSILRVRVAQLRSILRARV